MAKVQTNTQRQGPQCPSPTDALILPSGILPGWFQDVAKDGVAAYVEGKRAEDSPYQAHTFGHAAWVAGFHIGALARIQDVACGVVP